MVAPTWLLPFFGVTSVAALFAAAMLGALRVMSRHSIALFAKRTDPPGGALKGAPKHFLFAVQNLETVSFDADVDIEFTVPSGVSPQEEPASVEVFSGPHNYTDVTKQVGDRAPKGERTLLVLRFSQIPSYDCWTFKADALTSVMSMYIYGAEQARERPPWFKPWIARTLNVRSITAADSESRYVGPSTTPTRQQMTVVLVAALAIYFGPIFFARYIQGVVDGWSGDVLPVVVDENVPVWSLHWIDAVALVLIPLVGYCIYRSLHRPVNPIIQGYQKGRIAYISGSQGPEPAPPEGQSAAA